MGDDRSPRRTGFGRWDAVVALWSERDRQVAKFGDQSHSAEKWLAILMEEVGEVAKAGLEVLHDDMRDEIVQVAAVAIAWLEDIDRA